jgi:hypothetical protein
LLQAQSSYTVDNTPKSDPPSFWSWEAPVPQHEENILLPPNNQLGRDLFKKEKAS